MHVRLAALLFSTTSLVSVAVAQSASVGQKESGLAAVYSSRLNGHYTTSGQMYNPSKLTTAHKSLPYGTIIRVTNTQNHGSVDLRVNDRGPTQNGRVLDVTPAAAKRLHIPHNVMRPVDIEVLKVGDGKTTRQPAPSH